MTDPFDQFRDPPVPLTGVEITTLIQAVPPPVGTVDTTGKWLLLPTRWIAADGNAGPHSSEPLPDPTSPAWRAVMLDWLRTKGYAVHLNVDGYAHAHGGHKNFRGSPISACVTDANAVARLILAVLHQESLPPLPPPEFPPGGVKRLGNY